MFSHTRENRDVNVNTVDSATLIQMLNKQADEDKGISLTVKHKRCISLAVTGIECLAAWNLDVYKLEHRIQVQASSTLQLRQAIIDGSKNKMQTAIASAAIAEALFEIANCHDETFSEDVISSVSSFLTQYGFEIPDRSQRLRP